EVPEGVNRSAIFGKDEETPMNGRVAFASPMAMSQSVVVVTSSSETTKARRAGGGAGGAGSGSGVGGATPPPPKSAGNITIDGLRDVDDRPLTPEQKKRADLQLRFHPSVLFVIDWLKAPKAGLLTDQAQFVHNGKAEIQIWFTDKSDEAMAKLKELGFEIVLDPKTAKMVIGRLPIEKLAALAEMKSIRYVAPQTRN